MQRVYAQESLLSRCDQYTINTDTITFPRNVESSRASGSRFGGVRTYWRGEGAAPTTSKPGFGKFTLNLHKLIALAGATDELLRDTNAGVLEQVLFNAFSEEITFEVNAAIVAGTGAGQPMGIKDAACAVSVSKESGQVAATIVPANIVKMWSRLWAGCRKNAVWLINQDIEPQLNLMSFGLGTAGVMMYSPPGGLSSAPYATLMGRPVIAVEQCETLGTKGDLILTDLSHYAVATQGGPQTAVSMHLYFDTDQMAYRITFRIDGAPWWATALTPYKGSATQSCIVTLQTRS
jgi:HK97 family phage major capsid protein